MDEPLILDRYRLIERIAGGGSAEVWRARDEQLDREVAVKRLHRHLLPDEASRRRLVAEARAAAALSHPVIVGVYDVDSTGESAALVMELVDGESLAARIDRDGPLGAHEAAAVAAELADALYHAHQRGVIHRDVKPGNVLLASDGRVRLVDFGIAHSLAASAERLTLAGTVVGTLRSMAPEQLTGAPITPRTDLYGLGVVLHEALTGRPPYPATSPVALADAQRAGPPRLSELDPALAAVVRACLAYDVVDRPLHAGAVAHALRAWLAGDPAAALAMSIPAADADTAALTQPLPTVAASTPPEFASDTAAPPTRRRLRALPLMAAAALIGLVVVGAATRLGLGGDPPAVEAPTSAAPTPVVTPSSTLVPTAVPAWLAKRVEELAKECGPTIAAEAEAVMATMTEEQAKDYAEERVKACKEAREGEGDGNGGGGGNGNGGGRGGGGG
jgi:eukaryotic-like serine/threonine-protein kinase